MFIRISDLSDHRLDIYRDLPRRRAARERPAFVVESRLVVFRLLASEFRVLSILCTDTACNELSQFAAANSDVPIYVASKQQLRKLIGFKLHRGMLAAAQRPANPTIRQLVPSDPQPQTWVVCPHVVDPVNLAGIVRNSVAFGVDALLIGSKSTDVYSRRVVRVSMGTIFRLPVRISDQVNSDLRQLHEAHGFQRVATVLDPKAPFIMTARRPRRLALLFGSEGPGLDPDTLKQCDQQLTLPMQNDTDSLNLATASGVFLYHFQYRAAEAPQ